NRSARRRCAGPVFSRKEMRMSDVHRLHRESFVVDAHCDTALRLAAGDSLTPGGGAAPGHVDLPRLRAGGVDLQVFALWVDADSRKHGRLRRCLELLRSEEHTSELQSRENLVCRLLLEKKKR